MLAEGDATAVDEAETAGGEVVEAGVEGVGRALHTFLNGGVERACGWR